MSQCGGTLQGGGRPGEERWCDRDAGCTCTGCCFHGASFVLGRRAREPIVVLQNRVFSRQFSWKVNKMSLSLKEELV